MLTIFTRLLTGELPCAKVYEDTLVFAFMDAGQVNPGHVIVASREPYATILDAPPEVAAALMVVAQRIAHAVQAAFAPEGLTLLQANRAAGWQTVAHLHMHVLPRWTGDASFITTISETRVLPEDLDTTFEKLSAVLQGEKGNGVRIATFAGRLEANA